MYWWAIPFVVIGIPLGLFIYGMSWDREEGFGDLGKFIGACFLGGIITVVLIVIGVVYVSICC
tara:strand:+ start:2287 stop:2475 length:189 start_codon:yes stop_codon:yes gene_type:complete